MACSVARSCYLIFLFAFTSENLRQKCGLDRLLIGRKMEKESSANSLHHKIQASEGEKWVQFLSLLELRYFTLQQVRRALCCHFLTRLD